MSIKPAAGGWLLYALLTLLAALFLSWKLLAAADFLYPLWYELLAIDENIAAYGPKNQHRRYFELTSRAERLRLFSAIAQAIQQQGAGLATLRYHNPVGRPLDTLLTEPEIVHLRDVARLVDSFTRLGWGALGLWLAATAILLRRRLRPPPLRRMLLYLLILTALGALAIILIGPVEVFYRWHTWVFPADHPWFFYYEDSLLTTLLKAPVIFGPIVLAWLFLTLVLLAGLWWVVARKPPAPLRRWR